MSSEIQRLSSSLDGLSFASDLSFDEMLITVGDESGGVSLREKGFLFVRCLIISCKEKIENPDVRNRTIFYERLLFTEEIGPRYTKKIVLGDKRNTMVIDDSHKFEPAYLQLLIGNLGKLTAVLQKPQRWLQSAQNFDELLAEVEAETSAETGTNLGHRGT